MSRALVGAAAAALATTAWAWLSAPADHSDVVFLAGGLLLIVLSAVVANDPVLRGSLKLGLLIAAVASAAIGLLQYFGASAHLMPWVTYARPGEAYANLRQTNQFATLCWIGMAVVFCTLQQIRWGAAVACAVLLAVASAASVSRTGLLQGVTLLLLAAVWPARDRRQRITLCVIAAFAYIAASWLLPIAFEWSLGESPSRILWARIGGPEGCHSRKVLWANVVQLIADRPWAGWGWGGLDEAHFLRLYPQGESRFCEILDNAHNLPLHLAVELGIPAAAIILLCGLAWTLRSRPWREHDPQRQLGWAILAMIFVHSLLEYPLWYGPFQIATGAALGWLLARPATIARSASWHPAIGRGVAGLLLVLVGCAAWDYWRVSQIYFPLQERRPAWRDDPLAVAKQSWLFSAQARFAELTLTQVTRQNADRMAALARNVLRYSPEPRTVERLIEADTMAGQDDEAIGMLARFKAAYPQEYEAWRRDNMIGTEAASAASQD